jgi:hypothetical protein
LSSFKIATLMGDRNSCKSYIGWIIFVRKPKDK